MIRILFLCEYGSMNGGEQSLLAVLPHLKEHGIEPAVVLPREGDFRKALQDAGIFVHELPFVASDPLHVKRERLAAFLEPLCREKKIDLLHANSLSMGRLSGPVAEALALPSLAHLRDIIRLNRTAVGDLNRNDLLLAVSEATRQYHVAQGVDALRCRTLYNGIDLRRFSPSPPTGYLHRELGIAETAPLLGTVGQIGLRKGQDTLFSAFEILLRKLSGADPSGLERPVSERPHLLVVGQRWSEKEESRRFEAELRDRAARFPLAGHVHFLGRRDDLPLLLRELTLLVHPARQEPLGRVLLEAAACACPTVACDTGGTREIHPDSAGSAVLIPVDNPAILAERIVKLLDSPERQRTMGLSARLRAETAFDVRRTAATQAEIYREILERDA